MVGMVDMVDNVDMTQNKAAIQLAEHEPTNFALLPFYAALAALFCLH